MISILRLSAHACPRPLLLTTVPSLCLLSWSQWQVQGGFAAKASASLNRTAHPSPLRVGWFSGWSEYKGPSWSDRSEVATGSVIESRVCRSLMSSKSWGFNLQTSLNPLNRWLLVAVLAGGADAVWRPNCQIWGFRVGPSLRIREK